MWKRGELFRMALLLFFRSVLGSLLQTLVHYIYRIFLEDYLAQFKIKLMSSKSFIPGELLQVIPIFVIDNCAFYFHVSNSTLCLLPIEILCMKFERNNETKVQQNIVSPLQSKAIWVIVEPILQIHIETGARA